MGFVKWLEGQQGRTDTIGQYARSSFAPKRRGRISRKSVAKDLSNAKASPELAAAANAAWTEYETLEAKNVSEAAE